MDNEFVDISTSLKLQLGFGTGHVLNDVCASLWFTYFLVYFHLVLEFTATQSGNLMLIGQVVDALATPFVGYHSDHTDNLISARYGKRKIWHLFGTACVLASFPFIFTECIGCSTTHKWAQMYYFAAFIVIFQIGWAAVQISHLSLIPELSEDDHTRTQLTAVRYGFTVFSTLFVYLIAWTFLGLTADSDVQVGPDDAWKFSNIVYIVMSVGIVASLIFHFTISENHSYRRQERLQDQSGRGAHCDFLRKPQMYQVAGVYMSTRLVVNISQVLIPLYLHRTLRLGSRSLALIPFAMFLGSLTAAGAQRLAPRSLTRKLSYFVGSTCAMAGFLWIYFESDSDYKTYFIYLVAVLIGFGGAVMLVTSLALTADLVGERTEASAFVYGLMSFSDKLACGIAIALIQLYADGADPSYYRVSLACVCGSASALGLACTLLLPSFTTDTLSVSGMCFSADGAEPSYYRVSLACVCGSASALGLACTLLLPSFTTDTLSVSGMCFSADGAEPSYYRVSLACVCGSASALGLACTLLLPSFTTDTLSVSDSPIDNHTTEEATMIADDI